MHVLTPYAEGFRARIRYGFSINPYSPKLAPAAYDAWQLGYEHGAKYSYYQY